MTAQSEQALENGLIATLQDMSYEYVHTWKHFENILPQVASKTGVFCEKPSKLERLRGL